LGKKLTSSAKTISGEGIVFFDRIQRDKMSPLPWTDANYTCHKYLTRDWALHAEKVFKVKRQGYRDEIRFCGGGISTARRRGLVIVRS